MKKKNLILLLGLLGLTLPFAINKTTSSSVVAEEDPQPFELHYTEVVDEQYSRTLRYYDDFCPAEINEHFRAPAGCVLKLNSDLTSLDYVTEEVKKLPEAAGTNKVDMVDVVVYRKIGEVGIYSESQCNWDITFDNLSEFLCDQTRNLTLYELEEKIIDFEISGQIIYQFYFTGRTYFFYFDVEPYQVKAYQNGDLVGARLTHYSNNEEDRITVFAVIDEDLFNEEYGFKTDGRYEYWTDYWKEKYTVCYIDKATNTILESNDDGSGIEMTPVPKSPMTVFVRLSFYSGGKLYEFYSNEVVVQEKIPNLLLDGFDNRDTVGVNETHRFEIDTYFDLETITQFDFTAYYETSQGSVVLANHYFEEDPKVIEEDSDVWTVLTRDFFQFDVKFAQAGEYEIFLDVKIQSKGMIYYSTHHWSKVFKVTNTPTSYTPVDQALTLNVEERIDCVSGGESIDIEANFAADLLNNEEIPTYEWHASRVNVLEINAEGNKAKILPVGSGVVILNIDCTTKALGTVTKQITFNVISDIYSISTLTTTDEFHYSNKDLLVKLSIEKVLKISNLKVDWVVKDKDDNDVVFVDNGDLSITIESPKQNNYSVTALYNGIEIDTIVVEVRDVNVNLFIQQNIWWIFLITLAFMGAVIALKFLLEKKHSLVDMINKTVIKFSSIDKNSNDVIPQLKKVERMIKIDISYARDLNMDAFNQYEKTIRYLTKSLTGIKTIVAKKAEMSEQDYIATYDKLKRDLEKAFIVVKEIEDAKDIALSNAYNANQNNYAKIDQGKKKSK